MLECNECGSIDIDLIECEHKTGEVVAENEQVAVVRCTWLCGQLLTYAKTPWGYAALMDEDNPWAECLDCGHIWEVLP